MSHSRIWKLFSKSSIPWGAGPVGEVRLVMSESCPKRARPASSNSDSSRVSSCTKNSKICPATASPVVGKIFQTTLNVNSSLPTLSTCSIVGLLSASSTPYPAQSRTVRRHQKDHETVKRRPATVLGVKPPPPVKSTCKPGTLLTRNVGFRVSCFGFRVSCYCFVFRVSGFGFRVSVEGGMVQGVGRVVWGFEFRGLGFGLRVSGFGFRVSGFGFRVSGVGCRVSGAGLTAVRKRAWIALRRGVSSWRSPSGSDRSMIQNTSAENATAPTTLRN